MVKIDYSEQRFLNNEDNIKKSSLEDKVNTEVSKIEGFAIGVGIGVMMLYAFANFYTSKINTFIEKYQGDTTTANGERYDSFDKVPLYMIKDRSIEHSVLDNKDFYKNMKVGKLYKVTTGCSLFDEMLGEKDCYIIKVKPVKK